MHKIDRDKFVSDINEVINDQSITDKLIKLLETNSTENLPKEIADHPSTVELSKLFVLLYESGIRNVEFDLTLMRGFDYYTDIVFEVYDNNPDNNRSMFGGGRYDGLVALFGVDPVPTVGFGMGDVTIKNFLEDHGLLKTLKAETDLYVILIGEVYQKSLPVLSELRKNGLNVAVDSSLSKLDKQIKSADKRGAEYILFIGEEELNSGKFKLRNLKTSKEELYAIKDIKSVIK